MGGGGGRSEGDEAISDLPLVVEAARPSHRSCPDGVKFDMGGGGGGGGGGEGKL